MASTPSVMPADDSVPPSSMPTPEYVGEPSAAWSDLTMQLVQAHPLFSRPEELLAATGQAWTALWSTTIGLGDLTIPLSELNPRAQVVGEFFETLLAKRLGHLQMWRRGEGKEKDIVYLGPAPKPGLYDFELKVSGQSGGKIFGNRSYAQPNAVGDVDAPDRKNRSGYYLAINFFGQAIYRIQVGWLDSSDWMPQKSATGQMASLKGHAYKYKLIPIHGSYRLSASLRAVAGIGAGAAAVLEKAGFHTVGDVLRLVRRAEVVIEPAKSSSTVLAAAARKVLPTADVELIKALAKVVASHEFVQDATLASELGLLAD